MAPDLNSVPPSPRIPSTVTSQAPQTMNPGTRQPSLPSSRRASQIFPMNPPPLPIASPGGAIPASVQNIHQPFPPLSPSTSQQSGGSEGLPMRHPRPLTAAELHLELEKEQEAVVNRLTRELTALRAHSASVASNTSMSSTSTQNRDLLNENNYAPDHATGPTHPTASRRHRSSSTASTGIPLTSATAHLPHYHHRPPSMSAASPVDPSYPASTPSAVSRTPSTSLPSGPGVSSGAPTTARYEEVLLHRQELDEAKRENERLRRRVRELEALVRGRRASSVSTSASTSASEARDRSTSVRERDGEGGTA